MLSGVWPGVWMTWSATLPIRDLALVLDRVVGEGGLGGGVDVDARPGLGGQRLVARDVVGVDVGLDDVR